MNKKTRFLINGNKLFGKFCHDKQNTRIIASHADWHNMGRQRCRRRRCCCRQWTTYRYIVPLCDTHTAHTHRASSVSLFISWFIMQIEKCLPQINLQLEPLETQKSLLPVRINRASLLCKQTCRQRDGSGSVSTRESVSIVVRRCSVIVCIESILGGLVAARQIYTTNICAMENFKWFCIVCGRLCFVRRHWLLVVFGLFTTQSMWKPRAHVK